VAIGQDVNQMCAAELEFSIAELVSGHRRNLIAGAPAQLSPTYFFISPVVALRGVAVPSRAILISRIDQLIFGGRVQS
jgi:hypothetical protein